MNKIVSTDWYINFSNIIAINFLSAKRPTDNSLSKYVEKFKVRLIVYRICGVDLSIFIAAINMSTLIVSSPIADKLTLITCA